MPNRTRVKICGLTREQDVEDAVAAGADAIGLVFAPGSPRRLGVGRAAELRRRVPPFVTVVGLFVNESLEAMSACIDELDATATPPTVLARVALPLAQALRRFEIGGFLPFTEKFARRDLLAGRPLRTLGAAPLQGTGAGVDA